MPIKPAILLNGMEILYLFAQQVMIGPDPYQAILWKLNGRAHMHSKTSPIISIRKTDGYRIVTPLLFMEMACSIL